MTNLLMQRGHTISLRSDILLEVRLLYELFFFNNTDLPVERNSTTEEKKKLQDVALEWTGGLRETGVTLIHKKRFSKIFNFDWFGVKCKYR